MDRLYELWFENRKLCIIVFLVFLGLGGVFIIYTLKGDSSQDNELFNLSTSSSDTLISVSSNAAVSSNLKSTAGISVDIKGAVKYPGVYSLKNGARVNEVVKKAGGLLENADNNQVNLALILQDQIVVYIPFEGEFSNSLTTTIQSSGDSMTSTTNATNATNAVQSTSEAETQKYDINQVTKEELETIPGIGDKKAEQILAYRTEHGRINQLDELKDISGVGDKTFEKFQMYLEVTQ
ncbi:ComEA family DNA-binding protein [Liquorilactobacillus mali]|uniref:ComEA family DNA-binding protein n=1 Tax=Liquorilactobacillus mali TaxID=1618 RepID=UPI002953E026|nr:ComEA family DNA-binding protein [Liquorilactobacillus mali]MDV7757202.1 competence protein ComE [Liquorilactobacillus mali]